jgi:hypothetical protein
VSDSSKKSFVCPRNIAVLLSPISLTYLLSMIPLANATVVSGVQYIQPQDGVYPKPALQVAQGQRYRVKMWFTIDNANDGTFDNTIECYGELRINGDLYWQIPRENASNNKREKGQTVEVSDSRYARRQFIFNQPEIDYRISLRDADSGSSDDDVYIGGGNLDLKFIASSGGRQVVQFRNPQTSEASRLHIRVDRL